MWESDHKEGWAFKLWCWRRLLRVPWRARSSKQSILKEINPEYSSEGLMLKLQYFGHLMQKAWCWERLRTGREGDSRGWGGWMASLTQWSRVWANPRRWWRTGKPGMLSPWGCKESNTTEQQQQRFNMPERQQLKGVWYQGPDTQVPLRVSSQWLEPHRLNFSSAGMCPLLKCRVPLDGLHLALILF